MSSSPLYLAIVVVWLIVLVPMLLRKDPVDPVHEDGRREDEELEERDEVSDLVEDDEDPDLTETRVMRRSEIDDVEDDEVEETGRDEVPVLPSPVPRARVIARRRRRTSALTLLTVATMVAVAFGLGPWWVMAPPVLLLSGHLVLLREAAKADAERRRAYLAARRRAAARERVHRERKAREAEREAEVIALKERRSQVYDQYADARLRAAGD
ncbi:divisome protein SepX/GlpR [Nocardiopsis alba]